VVLSKPPGTKSQLFTVPQERNRFFTGRESILDALHSALLVDHRAALSGFGGIGKTQIAIEYAYRYGAEYEVVLWARAASVQTLTADFIAIASLPGLLTVKLEDQNLIIAAVKRWLESNGGWLLILDSADKPELVKDFLPLDPMGHILLTSRAQVFDQVGIRQPIEPGEMAPDEARQFVLKRTGRLSVGPAELSAAQELARELGYLPLALEQAGAFIAKRKSSFRDYLFSYRRTGLEVLEKFGPVIGDYPGSVATTWRLNFEQVEQASAAAADLLRASAFFSPDKIPLELVRRGAPELGTAQALALVEVDDDPTSLDKILESLTQYSLIRRDIDDESYAIHRLVQMVLKHQMDEMARRQWAERCMRALNRTFPNPRELTAWPSCERLLPHALVCAEFVRERGLTSPEASLLCNETGAYLYERGRYQEAEPLLQRALAIREQALGPQHPDVAHSLNDLAELYRAQGKYAEAEPLYQRALAIREQALGPQHPDVATSLNNLVERGSIRNKDINLTGEQSFDVFLSYGRSDAQAVESIAARLVDEANLRPFLDAWHLIPGEPWQEELESALDRSQTCAVFIGPVGLGSWENEEMRSALDTRVKHSGFRIIPVLLPGATMPERGGLPRFLSRLTWVDFRGPQGLQDADAFGRLLAGIRGESPGRPRGIAAIQIVECPYRGLQVFDENDARFFFGREAVVQQLIEALRSKRFLAVVGPSGSGKSSVVRAGLLPQLRSGALPSSAEWRYFVLRPGAHPLEELALSLAQANPDQQTSARALDLLNAFKADERALHLTVRLLTNQAREGRCCLVIDQFEEVFTLCAERDERVRFINLLWYAATIAGGQTILVITMRADFFARAAEYVELGELLSDNQFIISPMDEADLRRAIEEPAHSVSAQFEEGLVDAIIREAGNEPGVLPLIEHALLQLWDKRSRDNRLTLHAYNEIGGLRGALAGQADEIFNSFSPEQQAIARRVLLRLTQPGEGTEDTRRRAMLDGFDADAWLVVDRLAAARVLVTGGDYALGKSTVEVSHESLIRHWSLLRRWIDEDRQFLRIRERMATAAEYWQENECDPSLLFPRGRRLAEGKDLLARRRADLDNFLIDFIEASIAEGARLDMDRQAEATLRPTSGPPQVSLQSIPTAVPSAPRVFLCHSSADKKVVRDMYARLRSDGFQPWFDEEDLLPGQDWQREIRTAVFKSAVVIVFLSSSSITKQGFIQKEIKYALDAADERPEGTIFLIPARLEDCQVPERLGSRHWVNLFEGNGYEKLLTSLRATLAATQS
jgi:tetratricopeptide (TPR) repeat protein